MLPGPLLRIILKDYPLALSWQTSRFCDIYFVPHPQIIRLSYPAEMVKSFISTLT